MASSIELKPCPFCGSHNVWFHDEGPIKGIAVECQTCKCRTPLCLFTKYAVKTWNRREVAK